MNLISKEDLLQQLQRAEMAEEVTLPISYFRDLVYQALNGITEESQAATLLEASAQREQPASFRSEIFSLLFNEWFAATDGNPSFQDCFVAGLNVQREQSSASNPEEQLCKFYGVTTYADLVKAQAAHIEKLQDKLVKQDFAALQFPRKG